MYPKNTLTPPDNERPVRVIDLETKEVISEYPSIKKCAQYLYGGTKTGMSTVKGLCCGRQKTTFSKKLNKKITIQYNEKSN